MLNTDSDVESPNLPTESNVADATKDMIETTGFKVAKKFITRHAKGKVGSL